MDTNDNSVSGIITTDNVMISAAFTEVEVIPSAGFSLLRKAKRFGKWWVLKSLKEEHRQDPLYQQLLQKEFDILNSMDHPNIVKAMEWGRYGDGSGCIVMEYVDGLSLKEFMKMKPDHDKKLKIASELMDALGYIHSKQVTHRDLKPSNILITNNGQNVKVIDFGLSDTDSYSILKQPAGTESYVSPEQRESHTPDIRNDIYSLGRILQNLDLGKKYRGIVNKCLLPIDRRYENVFALKRDFQKAGHNPWAWIAAACVVAVAGWLAWSYLSDRHPAPVVVEDNGQIHEYVDMGNGLKVATCNIGADNPWEFGEWYAWGETEPYYEELNPDGTTAKWKAGKESGYNWPSYRYCQGSHENLTKYCVNSIYEIKDYKTTLGPEDDVATVKWGRHWRMPTEAECLTLQNNHYSWTWSIYSGEHPVNGYWVENKKTKARVFLPAAGFRYGDVVYGGANECGYYWSSDINEYYNHLAFTFEFLSNEMAFHNEEANRFDGRTVRAVYVE